MQKLRPFWHSYVWIDLFRKKSPELGMVPAQLMLGAVAMLANPRPQFLYFRDQFVSRKSFKIFVHILCRSYSDRLP